MCFFRLVVAKVDHFNYRGGERNRPSSNMVIDVDNYNEVSFKLKLRAGAKKAELFRYVGVGQKNDGDITLRKMLLASTRIPRPFCSIKIPKQRRWNIKLILEHLDSFGLRDYMVAFDATVFSKGIALMTGLAGFEGGDGSYIVGNIASITGQPDQALTKSVKGAVYERSDPDLEAKQTLDFVIKPLHTKGLAMSRLLIIR